MPRTERARRPPEAENRAHIPRAIASREAMLWQGCSLSPRGLERKAPRSVWATQLPASRPIRWIVRESREAHRTDSPAFYRTNFTHIRNPLAHFPSDGLAFGIPSPAFPRTDSPAFGRPTPIQPFPNPDMDGINRHSTTTQPSFVSNPRTTRFRLNHPPSVQIPLQAKCDLIRGRLRRTRSNAPQRLEDSP